MTTIMTHAFVGAAMVIGVKNTLPKSLLFPTAFYAAVIAMVPDLDVIAFNFGISYGSPFGHRGLSHSLVFALTVALIAMLYIRLRSRIPARTNQKSYAICFGLLFLSIASHPLLDMLTDGGLGCALFAPFDWGRYFFPVTPIPVSPIGIHGNIADVFLWELAMVWPIFIALAIQSFSNKKTLRLAAAISGAAGLVIALYARNSYFSFL